MVIYNIVYHDVGSRQWCRLIILLILLRQNNVKFHGNKFQILELNNEWSGTKIINILNQKFKKNQFQNIKFNNNIQKLTINKIK